MILAKTRLQWKSPTGKLMYRSIPDVFRKTLNNSGLRGLYVGLEARERGHLAFVRGVGWADANLRRLSSAEIAKGFLSQGVTMVLKQR